MEQTPSTAEPKDECTYLVSDWAEEQRTCGLSATQVAFNEDDKPTFYCKKHFTKAEPFLTQRLAPIYDL